MWALCRASSQSWRCCNKFLTVEYTCCTKSTLARSSMEYEEFHEKKILIHGISGLPSTIASSLAPVNPFICFRYMSSQAGEKSNNKDDDLEDGFSDIEVSRTADEGDVSGKDEGLISEVELSGEDSDGDNITSLGFSDTETNVGNKTGAAKKAHSPLFKLIMEAPRNSLDRELDKWVEEGNPLGRDEIALATLNLRRRRLYMKALQFVEWLEANNPIELVEKDYASHLDLVAKVHGLNNGEKYIEKIPESFRGEIVYRTLLAYCVSVFNVKKAEEVFNKMRDLGFPMTTFACNQLLLLYRSVNWRKIVDVLLMMEKENVKPSHTTYKILIDIKTHANDISGMEQLIEMMKTDGIEPDLIIQAMVANHYISAGFNEKAEAVLKQMEGEDVKEKRCACKFLLPIYADLGKVDDVARIWEVCETNPRLKESLAVIVAWGKLGKVENAEKTFEDICNKWKGPCSKHYNALLKVYANHKLLSKGKELAMRMADDGCRFNPLTWNALVKLYVDAGEVEEANSILQKASEQNQMGPLYDRYIMGPLYCSYMYLMDSYAKRGDIQNAERIFHRMRQIGYLKRRGQYQSLLQAYINAKMPAYGFRERMKADNIFPNEAVAAQLAAVDAFKNNQISDLH